MQEEGSSLTEEKTKAKKSKNAKIPTVADIVEKETEEDVKAKVENKESSKDGETSLAQSPEVNSKPKEEGNEVLSEKSFDAEKTDPESETDSEEDAEVQEDDAELAVRRSLLNLDSETALIEVILFLESEPQNVENLSKISKFSPEVVEECLGRLREKYSNADSGIELSQIIGGWMLTPKKETFEFVKERYGKKNEGRLSKAAIETLSIIAYSQPITRAEIESIRHVNVDNMMRILIERNFIKEVGKKDIPGKPVLYGTTKEFLKFFNLQSIADLPQLDEKESERFELAR